MQNKNIYITSPIYYVNGDPHIGHAYTSIACDIFTRWSKLQNNDVFFATGTDEFGQKIEKAAKSLNKDPIEICNEYSAKFKNLASILNVDYNDFIRTTQQRHTDKVQMFWTKIFDNNWIYKGKYEGWYAIRDEAFYDEKELINGKAPSGADVEWKSEECYFFKLSKFQNILELIYKNKQNFIMPQTRLNEIASFVKSGLNDLCVSRSNFEWGVKVPNNTNHVIYVWLDALTNYISILDYNSDSSLSGANYKKYWENANKKIHFVGKDILRFHAVYWPAFLLASIYNEESLQNLTIKDIEGEIPDTIFAHGWWTKDGEKMSKSLGNVVDPFETVKNYGCDKFRYFLFASNTFGNDGNFSENDFIAKTNSDLVNNFGNLVQRTLTIITKNFDGFIPQLSENSDFIKHSLLTTNLIDLINNDMNSFSFEKALQEIIKYSSLANEFIDKSAPWKLVKEGENGIKKAQDVMFILVFAILQIAQAFQSFIPSTSKKVFDFFNILPNQNGFYTNLQINHKNKTNPPQILFDRL